MAVTTQLVFVPLRLFHHDWPVAADTRETRDGAVFKLVVTFGRLSRSSYFGKEQVVLEPILLELLQYESIAGQGARAHFRFEPITLSSQYSKHLEAI